METHVHTQAAPHRERINSRLLQVSANIQASLHDIKSAAAPSSPPKELPKPHGHRQAIYTVKDGGAATDADTPTLVRVSKAKVQAVYGGTIGFYTIALAVECESTVVIHLLIQNDRSRAVRLSTSRLCFTPASYGIPQAVGVQAVDVTRDDISILHRVFSQDERFDQLEMPSVAVSVFVNEATFVWSMGGDAILQELNTNTFARRLPLLIPGMTDDTEHHGHQGHIASSRDVYFSSMACGENFTVAVSSQSCLAFSFGQGTDGEMGNHASFSTKQPVRIDSTIFATPQERPAIVALSCGKHHVAVSTRAGQMFTWGSGRFGQLGHCNYLDLNAPKLVQVDRQDVANNTSHSHHMTMEEGTVVTSVACGGFHTLAITDEQRVLAFGHNKAGQLGLGHRQLRLDNGWRSSVPTRIDALVAHSIHQVAAGVHHSACISTQGELFTWGCGVDGRLGLNSSDTCNLPTLVVALKLLNVVPKIVRCGGRHSALISDVDTLYTWGANDFGQLGVGDTRPRLIPTVVPFPVRSPITDVSLGHFHSAATTGHGEVYTWGYDINGGLGMDIDGTILLEPTHVSALEGFGAVQVQCGWTHTTVLTKRNHPIRRTTLVSNQDGDGGDAASSPSPLKRGGSMRRPSNVRPQSARPAAAKAPLATNATRQAQPPTPASSSSNPMVAPDMLPASLDTFRKRMDHVRPQSAHPRRQPTPPDPTHNNLVQPTIPHPFLRRNQRRPQTARPARDLPTKATNKSKTSVRDAARQLVHHVIQLAMDRMRAKHISRRRPRPRSALHQRVFTRPAPVLPATTPRKGPLVVMDAADKQLLMASSETSTTHVPTTGDKWASFVTDCCVAPPPTKGKRGRPVRLVRPKSALPRTDRRPPMALTLELERDKKRTWTEGTMESVLKDKQRRPPRIWLR
ncbi:Aste57867_204 [Aphanomyces stellatus]|uniref:Aste57867_204 protein n=1 Tax=Aphanomyces stellatus TaxID=120398 RepID=A0A485K2G5_9STRA|nr:hypothetical protein As57867_000204 [Aphanomyces stellatus]VFT77430.1 Aste57867_204 [Aphanomyces stellatus]